MATFTLLRQVLGALQEVRTIEVSSGAADASKVPNTNADGVLDPSLLNGVSTSAGAGSAGAVPVLDAGGKLDVTMMPSGIAADTQSVIASETVAAGDFLNLWNDGGTLKVRKADASNGRQADGFCIAGAASGAAVTVYFEGTNGQVTGRTPAAKQFLSATTAGAATESPPTTAGHIVQFLGPATGANAISFEAAAPITLA